MLFSHYRQDVDRTYWTCFERTYGYVTNSTQPNHNARGSRFMPKSDSSEMRRFLDVLLKHGNFTRAAKDLSMSQP